MRVLVIEDEPGIRQELQHQLTERGFEVDSAANGEEGLRVGMECHVDAAIVDLGLPGIGGMEVIRRWRSATRTFPVLVLTARSSWSDKVDAFDAGTDDYVTKPFHFEELVARLHAIVRRAAIPPQPSELICGPIVLDLGRQKVTVCGRVISLSPCEHRILECLMSHAGRLVPKDELVRWAFPGDEPHGDPLKVHVCLLRRKIDPDDLLRPIEAVRGQGYRFTLLPEG